MEIADQNTYVPTRARDVARSAPFLVGLIVYVIAASVDSAMTIRGMEGVLDREANPLLRSLMTQFGIIPALILGKSTILAISVAAALVAVPALRDKPDWLWKVPSTEVARRWVRSGDRSWVGYLPLFATAAFQALAAASWTLV